MTPTPRRPMPSTIPTTGRERVEPLERLAVQLVDAVGTAAALMLARYLDEAVAGQECSR